MKEQLGRFLAVGVIIGTGAFVADSHIVSAGGGPGAGFSSQVERADYTILIPNPPLDIYRLVSKTKDETLNLNRRFPFIHREKTGKRGIDEGIKELKKDCRVVSIDKIDNSLADVEVENANCVTIY